MGRRSGLGGKGKEEMGRRRGGGGDKEDERRVEVRERRKSRGE